MSTNNRKLSYSLAINEALKQTMETDDSVFILGQGVKSPWYVGNTCKDLIKLYGEDRVIDTPISENAMTGAAVGASLTGMKAIIMHPRMDFFLYAFDPVINQAANWSYMSGGRASVPVVFWLVINRGGEQAAQHSQAFHSLFSHVPGLKIIAPSNSYDVKGLLVAAINDPNPVVFIDDRWLYGKEDYVPEELYELPIGKGIIRTEGNDVTLVASSFLANEASKTIEILLDDGISVEFLDLRSIKPLDIDLITESVRKTGRLVLVDGSWKTSSINSEISATVNELIFGSLKAPVVRINLPDAPAPASSVLEAEYYISNEIIIDAVKNIVKN
ncbi:MAG: alpha-ketoacid dehydrogenase subunit beta [Bacteroidales bacterium]|nr:alpha-ketoacid dehydrogenase subunit beta [Bacteroidales bacterium]